MGTRTDVREKKSVAMSSVIASLFLAIGKLVVGIMTGSLGILSEAVHSALDLVAALITYFAVRVSYKPADDKHHYGYAKVENLSAFIQAILLLGTCVWIIKEAVDRLFFNEVIVEVNVWSFVIIIVSIIVDFSRSRALSKAACKFNSQALEADALHFSSDILSSLVVLIGLLFAGYGIHYADSFAALFVAVIVIIAGWRLAKRTMDALLDKAPQGLDRRIAEEVMATHGVAGVHKVRLRQAGGNIHGDLHVVVDRCISFIEGHKIADQVEEKLKKYSNDIVVHFEPEDDWEEIQKIIKNTEIIVKRIMEESASGFREYHDLEVVQGVNGILVNLHIVLPKGLSVEEARRRCDALEEELMSELGHAYINFHIEPCEGICQKCDENCDEHD